MKLAFVLFRYFPYGGLQRDFLKIARECRTRGHQVSIFTMRWDGEIPEGFDVHIVTARGFTNHRRCKEFARQLQTRDLASRYDLIVGFNKMPGLDVYFASDPCYAARVREQRGCLYRLSPRYRAYAGLERAVFAAAARTEVLLLNSSEKQKFVAHYQTEESRFHLMPPGIARRKADHETDGRKRAEARQRFGLQENDRLLLMVGSGFRTKGVDRSIRGLADLPEDMSERIRLVVLGQGNSKPLLRLAGKLRVADRVAFHGVQDEVSSYYLAADLLVHPSRTEAAGMVLIEALTYGLPVLVTDVCGYAFHIQRARAGTIVPSPFDQQAFSSMLEGTLADTELSAWKMNGLDYAAHTDLYSLPQKAVDFFEQMRS